VSEHDTSHRSGGSSGSTPAPRACEAEVEGVADLRRRPERALVLALGLRGAGGDPDLLDVPLLLDRVRLRAHRPNLEIIVRLKDDRVLARRASGPDLRFAPGNDDGLGRRRGKPELDLSRRRGRRFEPDAQELEERNVELVRHAVDAVDEHLGHPCEQLDQRDPGVGDVVLGPFRTRLVDPEPSLVHEVLEPPVVENDLGEGHSLSSAGMT
jgi:hypothetical protein